VPQEQISVLVVPCCHLIPGPEAVSKVLLAAGTGLAVVPGLEEGVAEE
jgi:hypothetical protein